jgi:hypothetical protein
MNPTSLRRKFSASWFGLSRTSWRVRFALVKVLERRASSHQQLARVWQRSCPVHFILRPAHRSRGRRRKKVPNGSTVPQPKTMSPVPLAWNETTPHPSEARSFIDFSRADQSIDLAPRAVFDIPRADLVLELRHASHSYPRRPGPEFRCAARPHSALRERAVKNQEPSQTSSARRLTCD